MCCLVVVGALLGLVACQSAPPAADSDPDDRPSTSPARVIQPTGAFATWQPRPMPTKRWADFEEATEAGRQGLQVKADGTLSLLHLTLAPPRTDANRVSFSWLLERELPEADLVQADISDSPVRLLPALFSPGPVPVFLMSPGLASPGGFASPGLPSPDFSGRTGGGTMPIS